MILTVSELGGLFLVAAIVLHALGIFARARSVLTFTGVLVLGTAGVAGSVLAWIGRHLQDAAGSVTAWAFGAPLAAGLFVVLAIVTAHDLRRGARKRTMLAAGLLAAVLSVGVSGLPATAPLRTAVVHAISAGVGALNSAAGASR